MFRFIRYDTASTQAVSSLHRQGPFVETLRDSIYDHPKYYDLIYGSDWKAEFDFLIDCFKKHVPHRTRSLFEPACGTGRLLFRLGKSGYNVAGNDLNPKAIAFCNQRLKRHGLAESGIVGDMTDFELKRPVDAAFNTINSFRHLSTEQLAVDHLNCIAGALKPGGNYILGLHLSPLVGETTDSESWSATRGHLTVNSSMWLVGRDEKNRMEEYGMSFDIYTPTRQFQIRDELKFRMYSADQFSSLVRKAKGLEIEEIYDFRYDTRHAVELGPDVEDVVFILKKR